MYARGWQREGAETRATRGGEREDARKRTSGVPMPVEERRDSALKEGAHLVAVPVRGEWGCAFKPFPFISKEWVGWQISKNHQVQC